MGQIELYELLITFKKEQRLKFNAIRQAIQQSIQDKVNYSEDEKKCNIALVKYELHEVLAIRYINYSDCQEEKNPLIVELIDIRKMNIKYYF